MDVVSRVLAAVLRRRAVVLILFALLVPVAAYLATQIPNEGGIDKLIVPGDPDYVATREFQKVFPEPQTALLVFEAPDPWSPDAIAKVDRAEAALKAIPHVGAFSVLDALRRSRPDATPAELKQLATGTPFFRHQGIVGPDFLTVVTTLDVHTPEDRDAALAAIDVSVDRAAPPSGGAVDRAQGPDDERVQAGHVRKVGNPYVTSWIEGRAASSSARAFPVFGVLLVAITLFLFRSWRTLLAILIALGAAVALAVAAGYVLGYAFTIVSVLVPLTILVTTLATLVYLHSRFVDRPDGLPLEEHHLAALRNKWKPVTASTLAAVMGFAALAVSRIRPIREMGIWTAIGLGIAWVVAFTLFPALQRVLRTPTRAIAQGSAWDRFATWLPRASYRLRWPLVLGALAACAVGAALLFGVPGVVGGASVDVDSLANIDSSTDVYQDLTWFRAHVMQLNAARVWIHLKGADATDPEVLHAVDRFQSALEASPHVTGVAGPTTMLRMRGYLAGRGEALPADAAAFEHTTADVEQLMLTDPQMRAFIDANGLSDLQLSLLFDNGDAAGYADMAARVDAAWAQATAQTPALAGSTARLVGDSLLQAKVGANLVPTLAESFLLTAGLIFVVFLFLFRSGLERLLAMIPSLFALLVTFVGMRLFGGSLNVATIIIATTVLGTTENDQIHFFHHMHEKTGEPLEARMHHALRISARAIVFATLINAAGFLGLAVSSFPPVRQFGLMTSAAFVLSLVADFTALPAALWIAARRQKPAPRPAPDTAA